MEEANPSCGLWPCNVCIHWNPESDGCVLRFQKNLYELWSQSRYIGDGHPPFKKGNPYNVGFLNPYGLGLMSLSPIIYGNVMGVDRPSHI